MVEEKLQGLLPSTLPVTIGDLPSTQNDSICIIMYDGGFNTEYFGKKPDPVTVLQPVAKFVVRHHSYEVAKQWIEQIQDTLHRHTDDYFLSILLAGTPLYLGRSAQKLHEFQVTFNIQVRGEN